MIRTIESADGRGPGIALPLVSNATQLLFKGDHEFRVEVVNHDSIERSLPLPDHEECTQETGWIDRLNGIDYSSIVVFVPNDREISRSAPCERFESRIVKDN